MSLMLEHGIAAVLGGLDHAGVAAGPERDAVRTAHPHALERGDSARHGAGVVGVVVTDRERVVRRRGRDAGDAAHGAVEHCPILGKCGPTGGGGDAVEIRRAIAPIEGFELGARYEERRAQLDQGLHAPR